MRLQVKKIDGRCCGSSEHSTILGFLALTILVVNKAIKIEQSVSSLISVSMNREVKVKCNRGGRGNGKKICRSDELKKWGKRAETAWYANHLSFFVECCCLALAFLASIVGRTWKVFQCRKSTSKSPLKCAFLKISFPKREVFFCHWCWSINEWTKEMNVMFTPCVTFHFQSHYFTLLLSKITLPPTCILTISLFVSCWCSKY